MTDIYLYINFLRIKNKKQHGDENSKIHRTSADRNVTMM